LLSTAILIGLVALYLWYLLAEATLFDRVFSYPREHWGPLWGCPWCSGFWLTGLIVLVNGYDLLVHLAAAAVCGFIGSRHGD
jgi:hypothetical protein